MVAWEGLGEPGPDGAATFHIHKMGACTMAGRPRVPEAVAQVTGAAAKNPQRHRDRANPKVTKLGPPPTYLNPEEVRAWRLFEAELPWLGSSDRVVVEMAVRIRAKMAEGMLSMAAMTEMRQILNALGATPAARSKVIAPPEEEDEDPADRFFN